MSHKSETAGDRMYLYLDYETRGPEDIKRTGGRRYARTAQPILAAWYLSETPNPVPPDQSQVRQWDYFTGEPFPDDLREMLQDPRVTKSAFNAPFEIAITEACLWVLLDLSQWRCTMAWAYSRAFTGALAQVGGALGLPQSLLKQPGGAQLITRFSKPRVPTKANPKNYFEPDDSPEQWEQFRLYNRQDVVAEMAIAYALQSHPWTEDEHQLWQWDQRINARGLPIDLKFAQGAADLVKEQGEKYLDEIAYVTQVKNPNSRDQVLKWLQGQGAPIEDMQQETLEEVALSSFLTARVREVIRLRLATSQAATKKYAGLLQRQIAGRLHDTLQIWGAGRTGRWSGRGFQLQNLKRPPKWINQFCVAESVIGKYFLAIYKGLQSLEILGGSIRAVIKAPEGKTLVVSDLASIESRVVGWLSGCTWINSLFARNLDTYKAFAEIWLRVPYDQVTKEQRTLAKPPFLGFAYRLGWKTLITYAEGMGIELDKEQSKTAIEAARKLCPEVVQLWAIYERAVEFVTQTGATVETHYVVFRREGDFLTVRLSSGRKLYYHKPEMQMRLPPWEAEKKRLEEEDPKSSIRPAGYWDSKKTLQFTYMGQSQFTHKWERLTNHGGRWVEQITQAIARDILVHGMLLYDAKGGSIVGHVHDEIIAEESEKEADSKLRVLDKCLSTVPRWTPGLLLKSAGYVSSRYRKG